MVERRVNGSNDYLMGTNLAGGPIRSFQYPGNYGQPSDMGHWYVTCDDHGGVHTNSGIMNRAYFLTALNIGADRAQQIFYQAMTAYTSSTATYSLFRSGAVQAAKDLGYFDSIGPMTGAFDAVGIGQNTQVPTPNCGGIIGVGICLASTAVSGDGIQGLQSGEAGADKVIDTIYRLRDRVMRNDQAGQYYINEYYDVSARASQLLIADPGLRQEAASLLQDLTPPLSALADGNGDQVTLTQGLADEMTSFLDHLETADSSSGGGKLRGALNDQEQLADIDSLVGMNLDDALDELDQRVGAGAAALGG